MTVDCFSKSVYSQNTVNVNELFPKTCWNISVSKEEALLQVPSEVQEVHISLLGAGPIRCASELFLATNHNAQEVKLAIRLAKM